MGLSIHYNGEFKREASLSSMIEEIEDIAKIYNWKYHIYKEHFEERLFGKKEYSNEVYGISFTPTNCETVFFTFLSNGRMCNLMNLQFYGKTENTEEHNYLYMLFTKTQYAGIELHKLLIHLFKYLSEKYFSKFELVDEGKYWETSDEKVLQEMFDQYTDMIEGFSSSLEIYPKEANESFVEYFARLMNQMRERR